MTTATTTATPPTAAELARRHTGYESTTDAAALRTIAERIHAANVERLPNADTLRAAERYQRLYQGSQERRQRYPHGARRCLTAYNAYAPYRVEGVAIPTRQPTVDEIFDSLKQCAAAGFAILVSPGDFDGSVLILAVTEPITFSPNDYDPSGEEGLTGDIDLGRFLAGIRLGTSRYSGTISGIAHPIDDRPRVGDHPHPHVCGDSFGSVCLGDLGPQLNLAALRANYVWAVDTLAFGLTQYNHESPYAPLVEFHPEESSNLCTCCGCWFDMEQDGSGTTDSGDDLCNGCGYTFGDGTTVLYDDTRCCDHCGERYMIDDLRACPCCNGLFCETCADNA